MLKSILKEIIYREKATSKTYIEYLRKKGIQIGEDCTIYAPNKTIIDEQYPWLISIGNHVRITEGVIILTHDYSWSVLKRVDIDGKKGAILGAAGEVSIGDNVFIGINSIILRNVIIGDNVIIGAGSVVSKDCESGWVYAGNPAKKIITVREFYEKRFKLQIEEAKMLAQKYYERYNRFPEPEVFHEFFMLFEHGDVHNEVFRKKMELGNNYIESYNYLSSRKPVFDGFNEFLKYAIEKM